MTTQRILLAILLLFIAKPAGAVTCTLTGTVKIEPMDAYYCDSDLLSCSNWNERDLDTKIGSANAAPMRYMWITVRQGSTQVGHAVTNSAGAWTATLNFASGVCAGKVVDIRYYFNRIHEDDVALPNPRERFVLVNLINEATNPEPGTSAAYHSIDGQTLSGNTTAGPALRFLNTGINSATPTVRRANVYYTAESAVSEMVTWPTLSAGFSKPSGTMPVRIGYEDTFDGGGIANPSWNGLILGWNRYRNGAIVRHELGHLAHGYLHGGHRNADCQTYNFNTPSTSSPLYNKYSDRSCEYGSAATSEGFASFLGLRSIVESGINAFWCTCESPASQQVCSDLAAGLSDSDGDWMTGCVANSGLAPVGFLGVGDIWADHPFDCIRLRGDESCTCSGSPCSPAFYNDAGWRNYAQVLRFLWDMLDSTTDGGQDDTELTISGLLNSIVAMPCNGNFGGFDGSCEEQASTELPPFFRCNPSTDGFLAPPGSGTRDSYNVYDFAEAFSGDQAAERTLNCVQGATD